MAAVVGVVDAAAVVEVVAPGAAPDEPAPAAGVPAGAWAGSNTTRTRLFLLSAIQRFPSLSRFRSWIVLNCASMAGAGPGSPATFGLCPSGLAWPLPAMVVMTPSLSIRRMRAPPSSATKRLPAPSAAMPRGPLRWAAVAGPPSPAESAGIGYWLASAAFLAASTSPATVEILPSGPTLRTRLFSLSEM